MRDHCRNQHRVTLSLTGAALMALAGFCGPARASVLADSVNTSFSADPGYYQGPNDGGWLYTPSSSYALSGIQTEFSLPTGLTIENRTVTVVVYQNNTPSAGGTLLGSFNFDSSVADGQLGGGTFSSPISLSAGTQYFIGFENVGPLSSGVLGVQVTSDSSAQFLSNWYFDATGNSSCPVTGTFACEDTATDEFGQPILAFYESSPVSPPPSAAEPSSLALLLAGLVMVSWSQRRRFRAHF